MKKLLFLLLLPILAHGQGIVQNVKTPSTGPHAGNQYFSWYSGAFTGYVIMPIGTTANINRETGIEGQVFLQTSDNSIQVWHSGHWVSFGGGSPSPPSPTTITAGVTADPLTIPYTGNASTTYILRRASDNSIDWNTNVSYDGTNFVVSGDQNGSGKFADSMVFAIKP